MSWNISASPSIKISHRATVNGTELDLTPTEFRLLECLLRQPGRAFTRHQLMDAAIGEGRIVLERTIDVHIKIAAPQARPAGDLRSKPSAASATASAK